MSRTLLSLPFICRLITHPTHPPSIVSIGEVGGFLNRDIGADLRVEKMDGWVREMRWEQTGLPFLSPSPNLAELEAVDLYPVLGQLE